MMFELVNLILILCLVNFVLTGALYARKILNIDKIQEKAKQKENSL